MSLKINNSYTRKEWEYTEKEWSLRGGYSNQRTSDGKITQFECSIFKQSAAGEQEDMQTGSASGYLEGEEMKVDIRGVKHSELADVCMLVEELLAQLEASR